MRTLLVHPSGLMYSEIFLRLEPLGVERVAAAARSGGHQVRLLDLQVFSHVDLERELAEFQPEAVGFGLNYLANVPEVIELSRLVPRNPYFRAASSSPAATRCRSSRHMCSPRPTAR